jgi:TPR repeat protein
MSEFVLRRPLPGVDEYNKSLRQLGNDDEEAFILNASAAEKGDHDAILAMGWFYLNGIGVKANLEAATHWYRKAARRGDPLAFSSLGQIALIQRDYSEALLWLNRAANRGHARSKYYLGKLYWRGNGVKLDLKAARRFFSEAAANNVKEAQRVERFLNSLGRQKANHRVSEI